MSSTNINAFVAEVEEAKKAVGVANENLRIAEEQLAAKQAESEPVEVVVEAPVAKPRTRKKSVAKKSVSKSTTKRRGFLGRKRG